MKLCFTAAMLLALSAGACGLDLGEEHTLAPDWEFRRGFERRWLTEPWGPGPRRHIPRRSFREDGVKAGWVTIRQSVPSDFLRRIPAGKTLAVNAGWISDVFVLYWNDRRVGGMGSVSPYVPGFYRHAILEVPPDAVRQAGPNVVTIAMFGNGSFDLGILLPVLIGPADSVYLRHFAGEILSFTLIGIYLMVGLYHLLLFRRRFVDRHNLFFGLFCVLASVYWFFRIPSRDWLFGEHVLWRHRSELIAVYLLGPTLLLFLSHLFYRRTSRTALVLAVYAAVLSGVTLFGSSQVADLCLRMWQWSALPFMGYIVYYIVRAVIRGNRDARYIAAGVSLLMGAAIHDVLAGLGIIDHPHLARYSFVVFVVGIAGVLANRFMTVHNSVEELNEQLEQKVLDRTQRLQETLSEVQDLKEQQDGDYFLTSLLLVPLGSVSVDSSAVTVRALLRQKKRFHFRKWAAEIGGDICVADTITLRGRPFVALINGDAMGKSIQGAGGAIVLGTVFKSLISRTKRFPIAQDRFPEQWLKECFVELQNVFVPFNGSMLVSAVMGLVDESSGVFYYVNAEHPGVVLFRGGTARFLDERWQLRKIGVEGLDGVLSVNVVGLEPDDVLVVGSDGRDDLLLGVDDRGHRIINENERLFVNIVGEARADLMKIEKGLAAAGSFTDDLSLFRIGFCEDGPAQTRAPSNPVADLTAARSFARGEQWAAAADAFHAYCEAAPLDTEALREAATSLRASGRLVEAADYGERYRLRRPQSSANLLELADTYRQLRNFPRAEMLDLLARKVAEDSGQTPAADAQNGESLPGRARVQDSGG